MARKYATFFRWIHLLVDYLLLNLALGVGLLLENLGQAWEGPSDQYKILFLLLNLIWFYGATVSQLYTDIITREALPTIKTTLVALIIFLAAFMGLVFVFPTFLVSLGFIIKQFSLFAGTILSWRISFLLLRRSRRSFWMETKKIVIVGSGPAGLDLYDYLQKNRNLGYEVAGIFADHTLNKNNHPGFLGKVQDCLHFVVDQEIDEIFCALPSTDAKRINALMAAADQHMVRFRLVPDVKGLFDKNVQVEFYNFMPVLTPRQEPLESKANEVTKRAFDLVFASLVTVFLLSWFVPLVAIIIKLNSRGPVFFKQLRSGKDNRPFHCYKFRTMHVNAASDSQQASRGDSRITSVGAFLRKTSIDELPQFINVLLGEMSVVGPRPHMIKHTEDYSQIINKYMVRQFLTPGITGWAQVNGYRGETKETAAMSKRVDADIWYLENWTFLLDLKIVFLTVWQSIKGNENAF